MATLEDQTNVDLDRTPAVDISTLSAAPVAGDTNVSKASTVSAASTVSNVSTISAASTVSNASTVSAATRISTTTTISTKQSEFFAPITSTESESDSETASVAEFNVEPAPAPTPATKPRVVPNVDWGEIPVRNVVLFLISFSLLLSFNSLRV